MKEKWYQAIIFLIMTGMLLPGVRAVAAMLTITSGTIMLDTQRATVNAMELNLAFDPKIFFIKEVDDGGSVVDFWVQRPEFSNVSGTLNFSGIIPGGINVHQGVILRLAVVPKKVNATSGFSVVAAHVLLNDGKGTPVPLSVVNEPFMLAMPAIPETTSSFDNQSPNPFTPQIAQHPDVFGGKYFLAFAATDENSGIDYYEVREGNNPWQRAASPYLLQNQTLSKDVYVRAVDNAGNSRMEEIPATHPSISISRNVVLAVLIVIILPLGAFWLIRGRKQQ